MKLTFTKGYFKKEKYEIPRHAEASDPKTVAEDRIHYILEGSIVRNFFGRPKEVPRCFPNTEAFSQSPIDILWPPGLDLLPAYLSDALAAARQALCVYI